MTFNDFYDFIKNIEDLQNNVGPSGGVPGLYIIFAKWEYEDEWIFVRAYETLKGLQYMISTIPAELYEKQIFKVIHVNGNHADYVTEIVNTGDNNDDAT